MTLPAADAAKYPMVARALAGTTIDKDTNIPVMNSYILTAPAGVTGFISPMSTLVKEKMAVNPSMTFTDAMIQLRNQMNLPSGIDMMSDYIAGSQSGVNASQYQLMHTTAQQMVALMAGESALVMTGSNFNLNRYRNMMAIINTNLPGIAANAKNGLNMNSPFMTNMTNAMQSQLNAISPSSSFMNYSAMFRNMTSSRYFWSNSSGSTTPMTPMRGGMM